MIFSIDKLPQVIPIGIQTESGVGEICFDVKPWVDAFGSLTMSVWLTRPGDSAAYPAENVNLDGNILCWTPNEVDTAISGMGRVEILGFAEGKRKLSGYCDTIIQGTSLSATQDPPDGLRYWVDKVVEAGEQAMAAVDKMPTISEEGTWMLWDPVVKAYADSGLPSQGKAGDKGDDGVGIQSVTQTTTSTEDGGENIVTVTKTDGSKSTFAVMNGRKGKDGTGVTILGSYESVDELKAAHPTGNAGDAYLIDGYLYVWSVKDSAWKNVGKIQGPQGEPGSPGAAGPQGPAGSDGRDGTSVTITNVSTSSEDGGSNVVTFSDGKTMTVKNGSKGKDGKDGTGVTILGSYESEDALKAAHPTGNSGDAYLIDGYLYVWSVSEITWKNVGKIQGPKGDTGATGPAGPAGSDGAPGVAGKDGTSVTVSNVSESTADGGTNVVTFSDGKKLNVRNGSKGKDGVDGRTPVAGTDYFTEEDKAELVEELKSQIGEVDGDYAPAIHADQHSWNDTLTWDGDETGRTTVVINSYNGEEYKVVLLSEKVPTTADLANGYIVGGYDLYEGFTTKEYSLDDAGVNSDGAMMLPDMEYIVVIPTDNYIYKEFQGSFTFPKAGVYFMYFAQDGVVRSPVNSLTIPGYNFAGSTDPITPERIGAAPSYHASESPEYGLGKDGKFGHLQAVGMDFFSYDEDGFIQAPPEHAAEPGNTLRPYTVDAYMSMTCINVLFMTITDLEGWVEPLIDGAYARIRALEAKVAALEGGS